LDGGRALPLFGGRDPDTAELLGGGVLSLAFGGGGGRELPLAFDEGGGLLLGGGALCVAFGGGWGRELPLAFGGGRELGGGPLLGGGGGDPICLSVSGFVIDPLGLAGEPLGGGSEPLGGGRDPLGEGIEHASATLMTTNKVSLAGIMVAQSVKKRVRNLDFVCVHCSRNKILPTPHSENLHTQLRELFYRLGVQYKLVCSKI
jgi:hypothetical protein